MASLIADEIGVRALVCLGYPFHPPGRPETLRDEVAGYSLSLAIRLAWCPDGDHSFKPRKASGRSQKDNWGLAVSVLFEFLTGRAS